MSCDSVMLSWDESSDINPLYIITPPISGECTEYCNTTDTSITISGLLIGESGYTFTLKSGFCECEIKTSIPKSGELLMWIDLHIILTSEFFFFFQNLLQQFRILN